MEFKAVQKYIRMSPKKLRPVAHLVQKLKPVDAVERLPFVGKRAADPILKTIKTALANAKQAGISETDLAIKEIQINEGPRLKRWRAGSRGRAKPYVRAMSHIIVVLQTVDRLQSTAKSQSEREDVNKKENGLSETTQQAREPINKNILGKVKKAVVGRQKAKSK